MDIFYRNSVNAGTLAVFQMRYAVGDASLLVFQDPSPQGVTLVDGLVITGLSMGQETNTQFQESLENIIYVNSFGDKIGALQVSGMVFPRTCSEGVNGIKNLQAFYNEHRASSRVDPVVLTFADEVIRGFLVGMDMTTADPSTGVHRFNLRMRTVPAAFRENATGVNWAGLNVGSITSGQTII